MSNKLLAHFEIAFLKTLGHAMLNFQSPIEQVIPELASVPYRAIAFACLSPEMAQAVRQFRNKHGFLLPFSVKGCIQRYQDAKQMDEAIHAIVLDSLSKEEDAREEGSL